jgi:single-strand DNA-binding protein
MNKVILLGRVSRPPETRDTNSGTRICNVGVVTNRRYNGEDKPSWHRCVAFGKTADFISQYFQKGDAISIEGRIEYGEYTNKEGQTVKTTDIIIEQVNFVPKPPKRREEQDYSGGGGYGGGQSRQQSQSQGQSRQQSQGYGGYSNQQHNQMTLTPNDEDIPF